MTPHIIGIAGASSSGKTELSRRLAQKLPGTAVVTLDSYYHSNPEIPMAERRQVNYDHPDALDWELLHAHLQTVASGQAFEEPIYSFSLYERTAGTRRVEPCNFVIVEGLFMLHWPALRALLHTKVYVHTDLDVCFERRLGRDVAERGRTPESVRRQYEQTVRPGAERFVLPTRRFADISVSGEQPLEESTAMVLRALPRRMSEVPQEAAAYCTGA